MRTSLNTLSIYVASSLVACAGHLETRPLDPKTWQPDMSKAAVEGVVYYLPQYMRISYAFAELVDKDGKRIGSADERKCEPVRQKDEIQIMPNFDKPYLIRQTGSFMITNKLGVTLANGVLTGVNAESATKAPELITAVAALTKEIAAIPLLKVGEVAACNSGPRIVEFRPVQLDVQR